MPDARSLLRRPTLWIAAALSVAEAGWLTVGRPGENYFNGGRRTLKVGNTQVVADMIRQAIGCDVYRITAADPYSDNYDATVARHVREQDDDARPAVAQAQRKPRICWQLRTLP